MIELKGWGFLSTKRSPTSFFLPTCGMSKRLCGAIIRGRLAGTIFAYKWYEIGGHWHPVIIRKNGEIK
jgi:hypothetical protein